MHSRRAQRARTYLFSTNLNTSKNFVLPSGTPGNRTPISDPIAVPVLLYFICAARLPFPPARLWSQTESNRRPPACKAGALAS